MIRRGILARALKATNPLGYPLLFRASQDAKKFSRLHSQNLLVKGACCMKERMNKPADSEEIKDSGVGAELIETALTVKFGISLRASSSYNMSLCSTGSVRKEAVVDYMNKCGLKGRYEIDYPVRDANPDKFPVMGRFVWAKSNDKGFSNKIKYLPANEDKEWIKQKLAQENSVNDFEERPIFGM